MDFISLIMKMSLTGSSTLKSHSAPTGFGRGDIAVAHLWIFIIIKSVWTFLSRLWNAPNLRDEVIGTFARVFHSYDSGLFYKMYVIYVSFGECEALV